MKKVSMAEEAEDALNFENLPNEVKLLKKLDHPNVVKYYESFVYKDQMCMVLDYADGGRPRPK